MEELTNREWTLLAIALAEGKPLSPVQLQKSVFLFGKQMPEVVSEDFYDFAPYNYGPFCSDVYADVEVLAQEGLATIITPVNRKYSEYCATPEGISKGRELVELLPGQAVGRAQTIVDWVRKQSFKSLVSAVYEEYPDYKVNSIFAG